MGLVQAPGQVQHCAVDDLQLGGIPLVAGGKDMQALDAHMIQPGGLLQQGRHGLLVHAEGRRSAAADDPVALVDVEGRVDPQVQGGLPGGQGIKAGQVLEALGLHPHAHLQGLLQLRRALAGASKEGTAHRQAQRRHPLQLPDGGAVEAGPQGCKTLQQVRVRVGLHRVGDPYPLGQPAAQGRELLRRCRAGIGEAGRAVGLGEGLAVGIVKGEEHGNLEPQRMPLQCFQ